MSKLLIVKFIITSALVHFVLSLAVAAFGAATIFCALRFIVLLNDISTGTYFPKIFSDVHSRSPYFP